MDLEQELKNLCETHEPQLDLYKRLERVKSSAFDIWQEQRLTWFTDHRANTHSRYIIEQIGFILDNLINPNQKLNPHELFVLLSACYLHDIGMQDFKNEDGRGVAQYTPDDYKKIRENHPKRSKELIIDRTLQRGRDEFTIDLDDDPQYLEPIAFVSQGHGTAYFNDAISALKILDPSPGNMKFRGELLTALLLMGDELDLHERRATFPKEFSHSPESLLHHLVHHYITRVEVVNGRTPKHRRISLRMQFPKDSDEYSLYVIEWVINKLRKQCELTKQIFETCTEGELMWDDQIEVHVNIGSSKVRRSFFATPEGKQAFNILKNEVIASQTINREKLLQIYKDALETSKRSFQGIQIIHQDYSDWCHLAKLFKSICDREGGNLIGITFQNPFSHGSLDVLTRIAENLLNYDFPLPEYLKFKSIKNEYHHEDLFYLERAILNDVKNGSGKLPCIIQFEDVDKAELDTANWLENSFIPNLLKENIHLLLLLTKTSENRFNYEKMFAYKLAPFTKYEIAEHLQNRYGYSKENADNEAIVIHRYSSGLPLRVLIGLQEKEIATVLRG